MEELFDISVQKEMFMYLFNRGFVLLQGDLCL